MTALALMLRMAAVDFMGVLMGMAGGLFSLDVTGDGEDSRWE